MADVWFVRHGESLANAGFATRTTKETELTSLGIKQSELVAKYIVQSAEKQPTLIVSSSYVRAELTAQYTKNLFPTVPYEIWQVQEFTYLAVQDNRNTTQEERKPQRDRYWELYDPFYRTSKTTESFASFFKRTHDILEHLRHREQDDFIVIFSHEQFIHAVIWLLEDYPKTSQLRNTMLNFHQSLKNPLPNGSILKIEISESSKSRIKDYIVSHLEATSETASSSKNEETMSLSRGNTW